MSSTREKLHLLSTGRVPAPGLQPTLPHVRPGDRSLLLLTQAQWLRVTLLAAEARDRLDALQARVDQLRGEAPGDQ